jgi:hypothetical protein
VIAAAAFSPAGLAAPTAPPKCTTTGLVVWLNTNGDGAAGTIFFELQLTNLSGHTCTLRGFPGVSAVGLGGGQLGSPAAHDSGTPLHTVTLANGDTATATVGIAQAANFPASTCVPKTAAGLRVFPPNTTTSKIAPFPFRACSHAGPVFLKVRRVK